MPKVSLAARSSGGRRGGRQQPVAGPVLQQPRPAQGGERVGVGREAGAIVPQRAHALRALRLDRVDDRALLARLPGQRDRRQRDRCGREPLRAGQQRCPGHPPGRRIQFLRQLRQLMAVRVEVRPLTQPLPLREPGRGRRPGGPGPRRIRLIHHVGERLRFPGLIVPQRAARPGRCRAARGFPAPAGPRRFWQISLLAANNAIRSAIFLSGLIDARACPAEDTVGYRRHSSECISRGPQLRELNCLKIPISRISR